MSTTTMTLDLNQRTFLGTPCSPERAKQVVLRPARPADRPVVPGRMARVRLSDDSVLARRLEWLESRDRAAVRPRTSNALLRAEIRRTAEQARSERVVFAVLATGSVALIVAAAVQSLQFVANWSAFARFVASMLA